MIALVEWLILFAISFHLAYSNPKKVVRHAIVFAIICLSAIPIDYLLWSFTHASFLPTSLQESFAINMMCFGIINIGLGIGGLIREIKSIITKEKVILQE